MSKISWLKFGDIVKNHWAGDGNPQKISMFLRYGHRKGLVNRGHYIITVTNEGKELEFANDKNCRLEKIGSIFNSDDVQLINDF